MGTPTEENRIDVYRNAPEDIRELYVSDAISEVVDKVYMQFNISQPFKILSIIVGDTILGFNKISEMPRLFQQKLSVSADDSQRMTSQLIESLAPVVKREEKEAAARKQEMARLADTFAKPEGIVEKKANAQQFTGAVEPIRTMEQDMNRVHGYGAYRQKEEQEEVTGPEKKDV